MFWRFFIAVILFVGVCLPITNCCAQQTEFDKQIKAASDDSTRIGLMLNAAWELKYSNPRQSILYTERADNLASKNNFTKQKASALYYKAIIYYLTSRYDSAIMFSENALELYERLNDNYGMASIYNMRGLVGEKIGDYEKAISDYHQSLVYAQKTDNLYGQSNPLHNIGLIYSKTRDYNQALDYFRQALTVREKIGDSIAIGQSYQSIGMAYTELEDSTRAVEFHEKALKIFEANEDLYDLAIVYTNLGLLLLNMQKLDEAETYLSFALKLQKDFENAEGQVKVLVNLATLYNYRKDYQRAINVSNDAIMLCDSLNLKPEKKLAYETQVISFEKMKRFEEAFKAQKALQGVSDSLLDDEKIRKISLLETRYRVQQQEQTISLQQAQLRNTYLIIGSLVVVLILVVIVFMLARSHAKKKHILVQKENELLLKDTFVRASIQSQEEERKRFAQDIHDGMGQLISALKIILKPISEKASLEERVAIVERSESLLNDMHHEIRRIAFNLMPHTLVQSGLVAALKESVQRINASGNVVVSVSSFDMPKRLSEVQEISLYRIVQEWINNVLKYSGATLIEVQIIGHDGEISITIEDNGRGFDPRTLDNSSGNGWKNINSRLNLIRATIDIDSRPASIGTTVSIRIPIDKNDSVAQLSVHTEKG